MEQIRKKIKPRIRVIPPIGCGPRVWECMIIDGTYRAGYGDTPKAAYAAWLRRVNPCELFFW